MATDQGKQTKKINKKFYLYRELDAKLRDTSDLIGLDHSEILSASLTFFMDAPPAIQEGIYRHYADRQAEILFRLEELERAAAESAGDGCQSPPSDTKNKSADGSRSGRNQNSKELNGSSIKPGDVANDRQLFERVRSVLKKNNTEEEL